jgi:hypothetical protein
MLGNRWLMSGERKDQTRPGPKPYINQRLPDILKSALKMEAIYPSETLVSTSLFGITIQETNIGKKGTLCSSGQSVNLCNEIRLQMRPKVETRTH